MDYLDNRAEEASGDEEDEDIGEETSELRPREKRLHGDLEDSSEEEDDDDEEAARKIAEGFIASDDEDASGSGKEEERRKERRRRKRQREHPELEDDDLDLGLGNQDDAPTIPSKFKRLKRGHRDERDINDIFDSDIEDDDRAGAAVGEFDDFIEEDIPRDEEDLGDDFEVSRRPQRAPTGMGAVQYAGMDEADIEDMRAAFGDGHDYNWALLLQEDEEEGLDANKELELKDVFEPSQLAERMLTAEDDTIRDTDIPERYQLLRKPFSHVELTPEQAAERAIQEVTFVSDMMLRRKRVEPEHVQPFRGLIAGILKLMNEENYEVPFIMQNRKDFLIHAVKVPNFPPPDDPNAINYEVKATKLVQPSDLWDILDLDLKFRGLAEKKAAVQRPYDNLKTFMGLKDNAIEELLPLAETTEEVQDLQDYLNFQYSAELKDVAATNADIVGTQKRARGQTGIFERLRTSRAYNVVKGFGISPDDFAQNVLESSRRAYTDDPTERPDELADNFVDEDYATGTLVLKAAKAMFTEELAMSPRMKKLMRQTYFTKSHFDCVRTEKGLRKIDEDHPYYEFKYMRNLTLASALRRPDFFLQMLKAEREGLIEVRVRLDDEASFERGLAKTIESDNFSEVADAWNVVRKETLSAALKKLQRPIVRQVKENVKTECEIALARLCKDALYKKLDQAPYKPKDSAIGQEPRVLALTASTGSGAGGGRDAVIWAWIEEYRCIENGKFNDFRVGNAEKSMPEGRDIRDFVDLVQRRVPDVIAVSGFTPEARALYKDLQGIVEQYNLQTPEYTDEDDRPRRDPIEVIVVNDEVARLFHTSERSARELPGLAPLTKYCVAIGRYLQSPLKEYISLGRDLTSISFHPHQNLVPEEKLMKFLEIAIIDIVNLVGVDINNAVANDHEAALLPYVCGLGPRKAQALLSAIHRNGGIVNARQDLVGDPEQNIPQAVSAHIFANCASFLKLEYDEHEDTSEYLDSTRIHPEDYDLARKVAADTVNVDEEEIKDEQERNGMSALVVHLMFKVPDAQQQLESLQLEDYADQLETFFHSKKRATLETIRAELIAPFEELRPEVALMSTAETFTMLTGETRDSLVEGMIIPVSIKKVFSDHIEVRLDCGVEGTIPEIEFPSSVGANGSEARLVYYPHQIVQGRLNFLDRRRFTATLSLRDDLIRRGYRKDFERMPGEWDHEQEESDKRELTKRIEKVAGHAQRVIKHPLFRPFNAAQAEEYLGPQGRGDCVIRPSSKGLDHLVVTWKVSDNVFQHIDILELDKENEFSVGRVLRIGKSTYTDLDDLIVNHIKAMAKKVDEIMTDERYQSGSKAETEKWLNAYMEANPKRAMYAFCLNREFPGYFLLCFKATQQAKQSNWPVKIVPGAFQLQKNDYPTMMALKNGFKTLVTAQASLARRQY